MMMSDHKFSFISVETLADAKVAIQEIGCDPQSIDIMAPKAVSRVIKCSNVVSQDAIIIKQDMLSIGGEVAVPKFTFQLTGEPARILVSGTCQQLFLLIEKLKRHYPRITQIAEEIDDLLNLIV